MWIIVFQMTVALILNEKFHANAIKSLDCLQAHPTENLKENFVKSCPEDWLLAGVENKCKADHGINESLLYIWPVTDTDTKITFRNVFCAACNNKINSSIFWEVRMDCIKNCNETINDKRFIYKTSNDSSENDGDEGINPDEYRNSFKFNYSMWAEELFSGHCLLWFVPLESQRCRFQNAVLYSFKNTSNESDYSPQRTSLINIDQLITDNSSNEVIWNAQNASVVFNSGELMWNEWSGCNRTEVFDPSQNVCVFLGGDIWSPVLLSKCYLFMHAAVLGSNGTIIMKGIGSEFSKEEYVDAGNGEYIVCDPWEETSPKYYNYISDICTPITLIALALHILLFLLCSKQRQLLPGWIVFCLCCSLFMNQFLFLVGLSKTYDSKLCIMVAVLMHYFFLAYFFWLNILVFDLWRTFRSLKTQSSNNRWHSIFVRYCMYGWGVPAAVILCTCLLDFALPQSSLSPMYGEIFCWLNNGLGNMVFFLAPLLIILIANAVLFGITVISVGRDVCRARKFQISGDNHFRNLIFLLVKLTLATGFTWWFGLFMFLFPSNYVIGSIFLILNAFQGVYIVFTFFPSIKEFKDLIQRCRCYLKAGSNSPDTSMTCASEKDVNKCLELNNPINEATSETNI